LNPRRGGRRSGERESGGRLAALPPGERERAVGEERADKRAPLVGEREREGGKGVASWAAAQEGEKEGAQGNWAKRLKGEGGGKEFLFLFQIHFPNAFSN